MLNLLQLLQSIVIMTNEKHFCHVNREEHPQGESCMEFFASLTVLDKEKTIFILLAIYICNLFITVYY